MIDARQFAHAAEALEKRGFEALAGRHVAGALKKGGNAVRRNVRAKARPHRKTGRLNSNVRVELDGSGLELEVRIHAGGMVAPMIVGGTAPHEISPVRGRALALHAPGRAGGVVGFAAVVSHPGTRADPFFHNGVEASIHEVQDLVGQAAEAMARELVGRMEGRKR